MTTTTSKNVKKKPAPVEAPRLIEAPGLTCLKIGDIEGVDPTYESANEQREGATSPGDLYDVGGTVFDVMEQFGSSSSRVAWKAVGNNSLATALFAANRYIDMADNDRGDEDSQNAVLYQVGLYGDLSEYASSECEALADTKYDLRMTPADMFDLLTSGDPMSYDNDAEIFEATISVLDLAPSEVAALREDRKNSLRDQAKKQQESMRGRKSEVLNEYSRSDARFVPELFNAAQHLKLFKKVYDKLRDASTRATKYIGRYPDAASDAISFNFDARLVDKAMVEFRRRNRGELVDAERMSAD